MAGQYQPEIVNGVRVEPAGGPDQLSQLRQQLDAERAARANEAQARQRAEADRDRFRGQAATAVGQVVSAQEAAVDNAIGSANNEIEGLRTALRAAIADGKVDEQADLQVKISRATSRLERATEQKEYLAIQRANPPAAPQQQPVNTDPLANYSAAARVWIQNNPAFMSDDRFRNRAIGAHHDALAQGLSEDSNEYFRFIDGKLNGNVHEGEAVQHDNRQRGAAAAPSRGGQPGTSTAQTGRKPDLTADEAECARELYDDLAFNEDGSMVNPRKGERGRPATEAEKMAQYVKDRDYVTGQHFKRARH